MASFAFVFVADFGPWRFFLGGGFMAGESEAGDKGGHANSTGGGGGGGKGWF